MDILMEILVEIVFEGYFELMLLVVPGEGEASKRLRAAVKGIAMTTTVGAIVLFVAGILLIVCGLPPQHALLTWGIAAAIVVVQILLGLIFRLINFIKKKRKKESPDDEKENEKA